MALEECFLSINFSILVALLDTKETESLENVVISFMKPFPQEWEGTQLLTLTSSRIRDQSIDKNHQTLQDDFKYLKRVGQ